MKHLLLGLILAITSCSVTMANPESEPNFSLNGQSYLRDITVFTCISSLLVQASSPILGIYKTGTTYKATGKIGTSLWGGAKLFGLSATSGYSLMMISTYTHKVNQDNYSYKPASNP
jgi:hypothetical protein